MAIQEWAAGGVCHLVNGTGTWRWHRRDSPAHSGTLPQTFVATSNFPGETRGSPLLPYQFYSQEHTVPSVIVLLNRRHIDGVSLDSPAALSTAPTLVVEVSTSTMKGSSGFRCKRMGAVVKA